MTPALLASVELRAPGDPRRFPFSVPAIAALDRLDLDAPVTYFVGENGSGKSTLLEGIAAAAGLPTVGAEDVADDATLAEQRVLARALRLSWRTRTRRGFFLRAEDFFGFAKRIARLRAELQGRLAEVEVEFADASAYARGLAAGPAAGSLHELERRYGTDLDAMSHGQSFLRLFQARFVPAGLHLLDEPEAALSPHSQLALLAMLGDLTAQGAQFVIATHSPILLAHPGAHIYSFDSAPPVSTCYDDLPHVRVMRDFLAAPERFLRHLGR